MRRKLGEVIGDRQAGVGVIRHVEHLAAAPERFIARAKAPRDARLAG